MPEHHLTCQEIVELVTDYLERALDSESAALVRGAHQLLRRLRGLPRADARDDRDRRQRSSPRTTPAGRAQRPAERLPRVEAGVIAYKFLRADGSTVFSGFRWPLPGDEPGAWVEAAVDPVPQRHPRLPARRPAVLGRPDAVRDRARRRDRRGAHEGDRARAAGCCAGVTALGRRAARRVHAHVRRPRARDRARASRR